MTARERICARVLTGPASGWSWLGLEAGFGAGVSKVVGDGHMSTFGHRSPVDGVRNAGLYVVAGCGGQAHMSVSAAVQAREEVENCCLTCWARQDRGVAG